MEPSVSDIKKNERDPVAVKVARKNVSPWVSALMLAAIVFVLFSLLLFARRFDYDLFIANKAVASAAVVLIGIAFLIGPLAKFWSRKWVPRLYLRKHTGVVGFMMAVLHAVLSLMMLNGAYYPRLFEDTGRLTQAGEVSMVLGTIALLIFVIPAVTSLTPVEHSMKRTEWKRLQRTAYIAYVLVFFHIFVIKWQGWIAPANWLNGLPPASLVAAAFIVFVLSMRAAALVSHIRKRKTLRS
jgi:DMSO/TMAO reductase YedYZ heme-binding membrane subunit